MKLFHNRTARAANQNRVASSRGFIYVTSEYSSARRRTNVKTVIKYSYKGSADGVSRIKPEQSHVCRNKAVRICSSRTASGSVTFFQQRLKCERHRTVSWNRILLLFEKKSRFGVKRLHWLLRQAIVSEKLSKKKKVDLNWHLLQTGLKNCSQSFLRGFTWKLHLSWNIWSVPSACFFCVNQWRWAAVTHSAAGALWESVRRPDAQSARKG